MWITWGEKNVELLVFSEKCVFIHRFIHIIHKILWKNIKSKNEQTFCEKIIKIKKVQKIT